MIDPKHTWQNVSGLNAVNYTCGHDSCGKDVSSERGWVHLDAFQIEDAIILICPNCKNPTFLDLGDDIQIPGIALGNKVGGLPEEIEKIWSELRTCTSHGAFTSAVLAGRKLLMHIAVEQGAPEGQNFLEYVAYLVDNHYAPPKSKTWVDKIRSHGNEATHQIMLKKKEEAQEIIVFLEMLLKFIYEFPNR